MCCNDNALLFYAPGIAVDLGIELVVPSLSTLLANAAREEGGYEAPLPLTILLNQPAQTLQRHSSNTCRHIWWWCNSLC